MQVQIFYDPQWPNPGGMPVQSIELPVLPPVGCQLTFPDNVTKIVRDVCIVLVPPPGQPYARILCSN